MQNVGRVKSFVDDLIMERGTVSMRVALVLRSAEVQPLFRDLCIRMPCASRMPILPPHSPLPVLPKAGTLLNCAKRAALLPDAATLQKVTLQTNPSPKPKAKSAVPPGQQTPQGSVTRLADSGAFDSPVDLYIRVSLPLSTTSQHTQQSNTNPAATAYYATVRYSTLQYATVRYSTLQYATVRYSTYYRYLDYYSTY